MHYHEEISEFLSFEKAFADKTLIKRISPAKTREKSHERNPNDLTFS